MQTEVCEKLGHVHDWHLSVILACTLAQHLHTSLQRCHILRPKANIWVHQLNRALEHKSRSTYGNAVAAKHRNGLQLRRLFQNIFEQKVVECADEAHVELVPTPNELLLIITG